MNPVENCRTMVSMLNSIIYARNIGDYGCGQEPLDQDAEEETEEDELVDLLLGSLDKLSVEELTAQRNSLCRTGLQSLDAQLFYRAAGRAKPIA